MKVWERRLMKDFHVAPVDHPDGEGNNPNFGESALERFRRVSKLVAAKSANIKWNEVIKGASIEAYSQIGRCRNRQSFKNQQNLMKAMEQARKLIEQIPMSPTPSHSPMLGYVDETSRTLVELLKNISEEIKEISPRDTLRVKSVDNRANPLQSLNAQLQSLISKSPSPYQTSVKPRVKASNYSGARTSLADGRLSLSPPLRPQSILKNRSPTPDSSKSLDIPVIEIESSSTSTGDDNEEHSPLKHSPGSPIKVFKRKAPKPSDEIAVSRPPVPKFPNTQGMIPPPPGKDEVIPLQIPKLSTTPATPLLPLKALIITSDTFFECQESSEGKSEIDVTSEPPKDEKKVELPEQPTSPVMIGPSSPTSYDSTEKLVTSDAVENKTATSPVCLRPGNKVEDVKTIKRQPKTGWL